MGPKRKRKKKGRSWGLQRWEEFLKERKAWPRGWAPVREEKGISGSRAGFGIVTLVSQRAKVGFQESYAGLVPKGAAEGCFLPPLLLYLVTLNTLLNHLPILSLCANKQRVALLQGF